MIWGYPHFRKPSYESYDQTSKPAISCELISHGQGSLKKVALSFCETCVAGDDSCRRGWQRDAEGWVSIPSLTKLGKITLWLVVWNMTSIFSYIFGMLSSQLTFIFFGGVGIPPTSPFKEPNHEIITSHHRSMWIVNHQTTWAMAAMAMLDEYPRLSRVRTNHCEMVGDFAISCHLSAFGIHWLLVKIVKSESLLVKSQV